MIELRINGTLCDVSPDFSVRLNRQLINPGELNTKDAQYSYGVSLPPTARNHAAFGYANVEEVSGKFNRTYGADLVIGGVRVFEGLFRLSEVSPKGYKGNLYVPAAKSAKDVFGDTKMNEIQPYRIAFGDFANAVSAYNGAATRGGTPRAIFPYTLYGLLPKVPEASGAYSAVDLWDDSVRVGIQDFPPSINVLQMLRHAFTSKGYMLNGTAFYDERLTRLYMSYKNEANHSQPWNYGRIGGVRVVGRWANFMRPGEAVYRCERGAFAIDNTYSCDLFDSTNLTITQLNDPGGNVLYTRKTNEEGETFHRVQLRVPASGYYKVSLGASIAFMNGDFVVKGGGVRCVGDNGTAIGETRNAVKLLRDRGKGDFGVSTPKFDAVLYKDNLPQTPDTPLPLFPNFYGEGKGSIVFVDLLQNEKAVAGFQWGRKSDEDVNPHDKVQSWSFVSVAKPSASWDRTYKEEHRNRIVAHNPVGYYRRGETVTSKFAYTLSGSPSNYAKRSAQAGAESAEGAVNCVVWLDAGELLTLAEVSDGRPDWVAKFVDFDLSVTPFRTDEAWLKINPETGIASGAMSWDDPVTFDTDTINLAGFLPADMKMDDFIDNFCKAFNLQLVNTVDGAFDLNVKQTRPTITSRYIDLDGLTSTADRANTPLGLPGAYKIGFTIDAEEEGYFVSKDDGGGEYSTGATSDKVTEQKSSFSFNWFKDIRKGGNTYPLAVISKREPWASPADYEAMMKKRYTTQPLRFWYPTDRTMPIEFNGQVSAILVSNALPGVSVLNYKRQPLTILDNYFAVFIGGDSHYTEVEGYLTAEQYEAMGGVSLASFNGDVYYIAELSGYDPSGRNKTKIKLIKYGR